MTNARIDPCRACGEADLEPLLDLGQHPIAHRLLADKSQAEYLHPVKLFLCEKCGLVQLTDPIPPEMLYTNYNSLSSWKWHPQTTRLVELIGDLPSPTYILEIASNDGSFLEVLRDKGYRNVLGVEPALDAQSAAHQRDIETIGAYFTTEVAEQIASTRGTCQLIIARHVLEHLADLREFEEALRKVLSPGGHVIIEVPNFEFSLDATDYSAIWKEHVNYFSLASLTWLLGTIGIEIIHSERATYSGDVLIVVGRYTEKPRLTYPDVTHLCDKALAYRERFLDFRQAFAEYLQMHRTQGGLAAVYGAGCRASSLINFLGLGPYLEFVIDDQPTKQGMFMPGSHLPVVAGAKLGPSPVELCLLAVNSENDEKVKAKHQEFMDRGGYFVPVLPTSDALPPFWPASSRQQAPSGPIHR